MFGTLTTVSTSVISTSANSISLLQCSSYTSNNLNAYIILNSLKLPNDVRTTGSVQIYVTNMKDSKIA